MAVDENYLKYSQLYKFIKSTYKDSLKKNKKYGEKNFFYENDTSDLEKETFNITEDFFSKILKSGFDINYAVPVNSHFGSSQPGLAGYRIIHFAVSRKVKELVEFLLQNNADFTCQALNGFTPLRLAFDMMQDLIMINLEKDRLYDIVNQLLIAHLKSENTTNPKCPHNISHFHVACMFNKKVANFFINSGVDVKEAVNINSALFPGFTPLHFGVRYGHPELVLKLLEHGADVNQVDGNGMTPLQLLIDYNIRINDLLNMNNMNGASAEDILLLNTRNVKRTDEIIKILMDKPKIDCWTQAFEMGKTFIQASCTMQNQDCVKKLIEQGVNINEPVNFEAPLWPGYTPLHFAAHCNVENIILLLENGANLLAKDAKDCSPLDLCIERFDAADVGRILKTQSLKCKAPRCTSFNLVDAVVATRTIYTFDDFLTTADINARVCSDSACYPNYTLLHLALMMSKTKREFRLKSFVGKDYLIGEDSVPCSNSWSLVQACLKRNENWLREEHNGISLLSLANRTRKSMDFFERLSIEVNKYMKKYTFSMKISRNPSSTEITNLHVMCASGQWQYIKILLKNGLSRNWTLQKDEKWYHFWNNKLVTLKAGSTLLHIAALAEANSVITQCQILDASITDTDGLTPAQLAFVNGGWKKTIEKLVWSHRNVNGARKNNLTHLHLACYTENTEAAENLLRLTTNVNEQIICDPSDANYEALVRYEGYTPLHFAIECCNERLVELLLLRDADVLIRNARGLSPLHLALQCEKQHEIARRIVTKAFQMNNYRDDFGITRLHLACLLFNESLIWPLIKHGDGTDVNRQINFDSPVYPGDTPSHLLMKKLLSGIDQNPKNQNNLVSRINNIFSVFFKHGSDLTLKNADNLTPILLIKISQLTIFQSLALPQSARFFSYNSTDNRGLSHFHVVCFLEKLDYIEKFLRFGIDVNAAIDFFNEDFAGYTPLHTAVHKKNESMVVLLLRHGANVLQEDERGFTPLHLAASLTPFPLAKTNIQHMLSSSQLNLQICDSQGRSILELLLKEKKFGREDIFWILNNIGEPISFVDPNYNWLLTFTSSTDILLQPQYVNKLNFNEVDDQNRDALFYSSLSLKAYLSSQQERMFLAMLNAGCEIDRRDYRGMTALHEAVIVSNKYAVDALLELGADINICDKSGLTPCDYLKIKCLNKDIKRYLQVYAWKLNAVDMYVSPSNLECLEISTYYNPGHKRREEVAAFKQVNFNRPICDKFFEIDIFSEALVERFPNLSQSERWAILDYLDEDGERMKKLERWHGVFRKQRRRFLAHASHDDFQYIIGK